VLVLLFIIALPIIIGLGMLVLAVVMAPFVYLWYGITEGTWWEK